MKAISNTLLGRLGRRLGRLAPWRYRAARVARHAVRRLLRKPRTVGEGPNLLPLLIQVLAAFTKSSGQVQEKEIDSILGFLRYDFPEAVYSELRGLFRQALNEKHDLNALATRLAAELSTERKIMLGVQLYDLIARAGIEKEEIQNYYSFMTRLGLAAQAIDIVYQLNAGTDTDHAVFHQGTSPLEALTFGHRQNAEVVLRGFAPDEQLLAFRYHDLILLKNRTHRPVVVRGRPVAPGEFCRVYSGQRIVLGEQVLTFQDLVYYFNAKKNVGITTAYVAVDREDEVRIEKTRSRDSCLEVRFGLKVQLRALKNTQATLNNQPLRAGAVIEATLDDVIVFHNDSEMPLIDLRRRARALGGRFPLIPTKSEYLVSNNPGLLAAGDILLSPGSSGEVLLKIQCDYEQRVGVLEVLQADRPILVGETPVRNTATLADGDVIHLDAGQILRCNFSERIIEEERNLISQLEVRDLSLAFPGGASGLDGVTFSVSRGEMVCVMGASGCGKSTLLRTLAGQLEPTAGAVLLNGISLYAHRDELKRFISYVPQDDAFDDHLTIQENLDFAAALRAPHLSTRDRLRRIDTKLVELGLSERRSSVVGHAGKKTLSGGERKRLNIGLDMIGSSDLFLFDEPTSGLSSKDAEHVIEIIKGLAHNKIVLVTIHQPTSKIFQMFNKALLLDKGGRLVFFGTPAEMLAYFAEAEHQQQFGTELGACPACGTARPEFVFDVLETPLRDLSGDIIYEENAQGQLVPARRFSPEYWRDKYESFRLLQEMRQVSVKKQSPPALPQPQVGHYRIRWRDEWTQLKVLLQRAFLSKLRNRANLLTTVVEAPLLAAVVGAVLRYSETGHFDFASAFHVPTYLFLMLIVAMFLGLTNSADDIIRDRTVLQRERNLDVRLPYYIFAKTVTLALFAAIQSALFVLIGNAILEVRGMFWPYTLVAFVTAMTGVTAGLLISSLVSDGKTAANLVPLVLIPQIILGGALIKYDEMNRNLDLSYTFSRWFAMHGSPEKEAARSRLTVPLICEFIPMRWAYEAVIILQAKHNPLTSRQDKLQRQISALVGRKNLTQAELARLDDLKDTLALLSSMESGSPREIDKRLKRVDRILEGAPLSSVNLRSRTSGVTAESLYVNQKTADLFAKAETEQLDYRRDHPINVFFGATKYFPLGTATRITPDGRRVQIPRVLAMDAIWVDMAVLLTFSITTLGLLHLSLHRQLRTRR